jgi:hypothetical protein
MDAPHEYEVFSNEFGSTKAVVCSCGLATTYSVLNADSDRNGLDFFKRIHERLMVVDRK